MIDKDTSTQYDDNEFHFDEFDHSNEAPAATAETSSTAGIGSTTAPNTEWSTNPLNKKNPRKLVVVGLIVTILIVFIVYHFFGATGNSPLSGIAPVPETTKVASAPANTVRSPAPQQPEVPVQKMADELNNKISTLDQTVNQQQQTITQLQGNISAMQDSMNTLNASIDTLTQQLASINAKLAKPAPKKTIQEPMAPPPVTYTVKAMVPGRAWLKGSDGSLLTVSTGSSLPAHGQVTNIDLQQGQVTTSDGSVFSYDINGN
jgi:intracellular multiplication protein IcmG